MKNTIFTIVKKEFYRFFTDKRLVIMLVLPGLLLYLIYSLIGSVLVDELAGVDKNYVYHVRYIEAPAEYEKDLLALNGETFIVESATAQQKTELQQKVQKKDLDLLVCFETAPQEGKPSFLFYYNTASNESVSCKDTVMAMFNLKHLPFTPAAIDMATENDMSAKIFSSVLPMLLMGLLYSGCISIAPESIAGEKERGTLGAMLVTPVKRSHIAIGKILSLSFIALLSGIVSFVALIFSLPKVSGGTLQLNGAYSFADYTLIFAVILSTLLLMVALVSVVSAFAKSTKEATNIVGPLSILVYLLGLSTLLTSGGQGALPIYLIPLYNSVRALYSIFSISASPIRVLITALSNAVYACLLAWALSKMFDSEKVMFNS